ncbi:LEXM protein, partial [Rhinopomastus cyanomelas]|nr:LEXM protein [Rhinopomastus cyanomelas]
GWARAQKDLWFRQLPHFQFKEVLKRNRRQKERLGPGMYNIKDFLQETRPSSLRGICNTRERRFRHGRQDCVPGPGTYDPPGNRYAHLKQRAKRSGSTRGLMDSRTAKCALPAAMPPPLFPPHLQGRGLVPGTYSLWSSIDEGLWQTGGCRPCQTFSRDRSKPIVASHVTPWLQKRDTELNASTVKSFVNELMLKNKKKGCFSTLPRNRSCPTEKIFWATLSQRPKDAYSVKPASYNTKPIKRSMYACQPPFWSSVERFSRRFYQLFTGNRNTVDVGHYDITKHEKYPPKMRYQSLYWRDTQRYLSNLNQDAALLERLKPAAKNNW